MDKILKKHWFKLQRFLSYSKPYPHPDNIIIINQAYWEHEAYLEARKIDERFTTITKIRLITLAKKTIKLKKELSKSQTELKLIWQSEINSPLRTSDYLGELISEAL